MRKFKNIILAVSVCVAINSFADGGNFLDGVKIGKDTAKKLTSPSGIKERGLLANPVDREGREFVYTPKPYSANEYEDNLLIFKAGNDMKKTFLLMSRFYKSVAGVIDTFEDRNLKEINPATIRKHLEYLADFFGSLKEANLVNPVDYTLIRINMLKQLYREKEQDKQLLNNAG